MGRAIGTVLFLALTATTVTADAAPLTKPIAKPTAKSPVKTAEARAAATRIAAGKIPKLVKFSKPRTRAIDDMHVTPQSPKTPPQSEPLLSAEELAVEVVELTPRALHTPQIGTEFHGFFQNWGVDYHQAIWVRPSESGYITFSPVVPWIVGHSLLVECTGVFKNASKVTYGRWSLAKQGSEDLGELVVDIAGDDQLSFVVPSAPIDGWERLFIRVEDNGGSGFDQKYLHCKFTRL
jgi:hypothetical protein